MFMRVMIGSFYLACMQMVDLEFMINEDYIGLENFACVNMVII